MDNKLSNKLLCFFAVIFVYFFPSIACSVFWNSEAIHCISILIGIILVIFLMIFMDKKEIITISSPIVKNPIVALLILLLSFNYKFLIASISNKASSELLSQSGSNVELTAVFLINAIVIGPISEELLYRFAIPNIFIKNKDHVLSKIVLAIICTLIWSFRHGDSFISFNINISIIFASLTLYWIYFRTQNVIYCVIFHSAANTTNILMYYWDKTKDLIASMYHSKTALMINSVVFVMLIFIINSLMKKHDRMR